MINRFVYLSFLRLSLLLIATFAATADRRLHVKECMSDTSTPRSVCRVFVETNAVLAHLQMLSLCSPYLSLPRYQSIPVDISRYQSIPIRLVDLDGGEEGCGGHAVSRRAEAVESAGEVPPSVHPGCRPVATPHWLRDDARNVFSCLEADPGRNEADVRPVRTLDLSSRMLARASVSSERDFFSKRC